MFYICHCEERDARRGNLARQGAKAEGDCFAALAMTPPS
jgi:hypothetical protein